MAKKKHHEEHENTERWLLTYADLITLLLAFFIVMFSMSQVDAKKFGAVSQALRTVLSGGGMLLKDGNGTALANKSSYVPAESQDLKIVMQELREKVAAKGLGGLVHVSRDGRGVVMSLEEKVLFESGSADLNRTCRSVLDTLATLLVEFPNEVRIEGHTDNMPIHSGRFASNWELSANRATAVVRYLIENHRMMPFQLSVAGFGEYRPVVPNDTPENRAINRRVDFVVLAGQPVAPEPEVDLPGLSPAAAAGNPQR